MTEFLLFRLYGPMAAWGDVAVGETRPSAVHPSKSAILGLVAAALGIRRDDETLHNCLHSSFGFGVRVDTVGELLRDYHTAQVPPQRRKVSYYTRRDELKGDGLYTILSSRDYRTDSCYTIALWAQGEPPYRLNEIESALRQPRLTLYLGRKSCPVSLPLHPRLIEAQTLKAAFDQFGDDDAPWLEPLRQANDLTHYYWEALDESLSGMASSMRYQRRDSLRSRARWQYLEREERHFSEHRKEATS